MTGSTYVTVKHTRTHLTHVQTMYAIQNNTRLHFTAVIIQSLKLWTEYPYETHEWGLVLYLPISNFLNQNLKTLQPNGVNLC